MTFKVSNSPALRRGILAFTGVLLTCSAGCRSRPPGGTSESPPPAHAASAPAGPPPSRRALDLRRRPAPEGSRFARDPLWRRAAADGDVMDLARLADVEGASGLLEAVLGGGSPALVALVALPLAPDAELAAGPLCDELQAAVPREPLLRAVHDIVARPAPQSERLDLSGAARCQRVLGALSAGQLPPAERDLVRSASAMLREAGISP